MSRSPSPALPCPRSQRSPAEDARPPQRPVPRQRRNDDLVRILFQFHLHQVSGFLESHPGVGGRQGDLLVQDVDNPLEISPTTCSRPLRQPRWFSCAWRVHSAARPVRSSCLRGCPCPRPSRRKVQYRATARAPSVAARLRVIPLRHRHTDDAVGQALRVDAHGRVRRRRRTFPRQSPASSRRINGRAKRQRGVRRGGDQIGLMGLGKDQVEGVAVIRGSTSFG